MIQTILIVVASIIALFFVLALVMGRQMRVEKTITIDKPADEVFDYIRYLKNHENFNVWVMKDPAMKKEYRGTDGQEGFVYAWDSTDRNVGAGEQEIKKIWPGRAIDYELRFHRPMQNVAQASITTTTSGTRQTNVQWVFEGPMKFPMNAMMPMIKNMLGNQLATSLGNLKDLLEK